MEVGAPVAGRVIALPDVSDPVFAQEIVGPGLAIIPTRKGRLPALAPIDGTIVKLHPHAFVIAAPSSPAVLVHLGLDTVSLAGDGFSLLCEEGQEVRAGDAVVAWSPSDIRGRGLDPVVPVIVLESAGLALTALAEPGRRVRAGEPLLRLG